MPVLDAPSYLSQPAQYQQVPQMPDSEQGLQNGNLQQRISEIMLRHIVDGSITTDESLGITAGVQIMDMQNGHTIVGHNQDTEQFAASINKLPVALLLLEDVRSGKLAWNQTMTWTAEDVRAGAGVYDQPGASLSAPLQAVVYDMLNKSGNTAVRILVNGGLGGAAAVNDRWKTMPQLSHTYLQPLDATRFYLGNSTPHDAMWALTKLMERQDRYAVFMKNALATNIYADYGVRSQLAGNDWIILANKVGILDDPSGDNRHDVGIIYNTRTHQSYAYAFMTTTPETDPIATPQAEQSLKDMGRSTLRFAGDKPLQPQTGQSYLKAAREQRTMY